MPEPTTSPLVFVSYAHEDASNIGADLDWFRERGIDIWLDEHIGAGSPWREEIAEAIERCDVFLFYVSPNSVSSEHCVRELNYALETQRRIVTVHLAPTEMSPGQKMSLMDRQAIMRYQLETDEYEARLLAGIGTASSTLRPATSGRPRETARAFRNIGLTALLIGGIWLVAGVWLDRGAVAPPTTDEPSVAVMPFHAITGEQALADGFHTDVLSRLTRVPGLLVISIDSLNAMQQRAASTSEIASTLNVTHVIQGDLQSDGETLRINLNMIDGATGAVVWNQQYERSVTNVFAVQAEIASLVAGSLNIELNVEQRELVAEVPTTNTKAWGLYRRATSMEVANNVEAARHRSDLLEQAIELDPEFADAISLLAYLRARRNDFSDENIALARRAVEINPNRADYLTTLALTLSANFPRQARRYFDEAQAIDPLGTSSEYAQAMFWVNGLLDDALAIFANQRRLDPLNPHSAHVRALIADRQFDVAKELATLYEDVNPNSQIVLHAEIAAAQNRIADAIEMLNTPSTLDWAVLRNQVWLTNAVGLHEQADAYLARAEFARHVAPASLPLARDTGRLDNSDLGSLSGFSQFYLQSMRSIEQYKRGDRELALAAMAQANEQINGLFDDYESRFGTDHVPGVSLRVDAPLTFLLIARLLGDEESVHRFTRKIRYTLANGGTLEVPKREHLVLMMLAALEHDHDEAVHQLDLARQHGLRNLKMLEFYGLVEDPFHWYGGLTEDTRYQSLLSAIRSSNEATIATLKIRVPELFSGPRA